MRRRGEVISFLGSKRSMITAKLQSIPKGALSFEKMAEASHKRKREMENKRRKITDKARRVRNQTVKCLHALQFPDNDALQRIVKGEVFVISRVGC